MSNKRFNYFFKNIRRTSLKSGLKKTLEWYEGEKNKNILICGSTGFIGRNLIEFFNQKQFNVIGVYNKKKPIKKISNEIWVKELI